MAAQKPASIDADSDAASNIGPALAARIRLERNSREWSLEELSRRAGVSRAMISKIEREECSPTATILGRLSGAFGISMSALLAHAEFQGKRLLRFTDQQVWIDPDTKYLRRAVSPGAGGPLQLVEVELPPRAKLTFPPAPTASCTSRSGFCPAVSCSRKARPYTIFVKEIACSLAIPGNVLTRTHRPRFADIL